MHPFKGGAAGRVSESACCCATDLFSSLWRTCTLWICCCRSHRESGASSSTSPLCRWWDMVVASASELHWALMQANKLLRLVHIIFASGRVCRSSSSLIVIPLYPTAVLSQRGDAAILRLLLNRWPLCGSILNSSAQNQRYQSFATTFEHSLSSYCIKLIYMCKCWIQLQNLFCSSIIKAVNNLP